MKNEDLVKELRLAMAEYLRHPGTKTRLRLESLEMEAVKRIKQGSPVSQFWRGSTESIE